MPLTPEQQAALPHCPFCGRAPRYLPKQEGFYAESAICDTCHVSLPPAVWSRRALIQPVQAVPDEWISGSPILERDSRILAALRNPWGLPIETRRYVAHAAADLIEEKMRDYQSLMQFAESQGVNCVASIEPPALPSEPPQ